MALPKLSNIPNERNMVSYSFRAEKHGVVTKHIAVFEYPDCTREFDGTTWSVTVDRRIPALEDQDISVVFGKLEKGVALTKHGTTIL